jgi:hypothetical protein
MPGVDAARTRWDVHWHMICGHESFVEALLLELRQLCLEIILQVTLYVSPLLSPSRHGLRTSSTSTPEFAGLDINSEISFAMSRCSLMAFIVSSTLLIVLQPETHTPKKKKKDYKR